MKEIRKAKKRIWRKRDEREIKEKSKSEKDNLYRRLVAKICPYFTYRLGVNTRIPLVKAECRIIPPT